MEEKEQQLEELAQQQVSETYIENILKTGWQQNFTKFYEELKQSYESQASGIAQKLDEAKKASKARTNDADDLYIKLLEASSELKQKDSIIDGTEE